MMAIRIDRIKVNRAGPLDADFEMEPGQLNLIYGPNETGKTYIVEAMIRFLFKAGKSSSWGGLRDWNPGGKVLVSGLGPNPVSFTKTGTKLEQYWEESGKGLPQDFSRLLVVRAGETALSGSPDGVGTDILKDFLSGERMLDTIQRRIPPTVQKASVEDKTIVGTKGRGQIADHREAQSERERIDDLLEEVNRGYAAGAIRSLQRQKDQKEAELAELKKAKRHHAALKAGELRGHKSQAEELPDEEKLAEIGKQIGVYNEKKLNRDRSKVRLEELATTSDNYSWVEQALQNYEEIKSKQQAAKRSRVFIVLAGISFVAAVVLGLVGWEWGLGIGALAALVFTWLHLSRRPRVDASAVGDSVELEKLETEFRNRFGKTLADKATIQNQREMLKKDHFEAEQLDKNLINLNRDMITVAGGIARALQGYGEEKTTPDNWEKVVADLRSRRKCLKDQIHNIETETARLDVQPDQYLDEDPGVEWDPKTCSHLEAELLELKQQLDAETKGLSSVRYHLAKETDKDSTESWEDLLTAFHEKRREIAARYREITAEILAEIQICLVVEELRELETERIKKGLQQQALTKPLLATTGRYKGIDLDDELILSDINDDRFPLAKMGTGAREQVFLALRLGFASISMKNETAFLILDDAFQHSDWHRRGNLVQQILTLIETGWQVFYFTMDDHIRDLFQECGSALGEKFKSVELV